MLIFLFLKNTNVTHLNLYNLSAISFPGLHQYFLGFLPRGVWKMDVKARRAAVVELHLAGKEQYEIFHLLKQRQISPSISRTIKRYKETNSFGDRPKSGRPQSVATPRLRKAVKSRINRNPGCDTGMDEVDLSRYG